MLDSAVGQPYEVEQLAEEALKRINNVYVKPKRMVQTIDSLHDPHSQYPYTQHFQIVRVIESRTTHRH